MPVAERSFQPVRGQKTICIPCSQPQYERVVDDPEAFRRLLDRQIEATPELFPPEIRRGYRMKDGNRPGIQVSCIPEEATYPRRP